MSEVFHHVCEVFHNDNDNESQSYLAFIVLVADAHNIISLTVDWIIDSGCTQHTCINRKAFTEFQNKRCKITIADGSEIRSSGKGTVGQFKNVNYVPEFKFNLLSVKQLTGDGYVVMFDTEGKVIVFKDEHSQILEEYTRGVYETIANPIPKS